MLLLAVALALPPDARIEDVRILSLESRAAIRLRLSAPPARVAVYREGELTRVSLERTDLGAAFSGGNRFEWLGSSTLPPGLAASAARVEALWIQRGAGEVSVLLRLPPEVSVEVRREVAAVTLVFREPPAWTPTDTRMAAAPAPPSPAPPAPGPAPLAAQALPATAAPEPARPVTPAVADAEPEPGEQPAVEPAAPPASSEQPTVIVPALDHPAPAPAATAETAPPGDVMVPLTPEASALLLRSLGPASEAEPLPGPAPLGAVAGGETEAASPDDLYRRLFPNAPPPAAERASEDLLAPVEAPGERTLQLGPLTFHPSLRLSYVNAEANLLTSTDVTRDQYLQIQPGFGVRTSLWDGRFQAFYEPILRSFGSYDVTRETSHNVGASLDLPVGERLKLRVDDTFVSGVLEAEQVDPGGEYFFNLARFDRNLFGAGASYELAPRWSLDASVSLNRVRFDESGSFFDYDQRAFDAGVSFDLTPRARTTFSYVFDEVPTPEERPEAESTAHSLQLTVSGDVTTLTTGQLTLGYRSQDNPRAGEGGRSFEGLVAQGSLTRAFGPRSALTVGVNRATPLSAFEENAFYVSTEVDAAFTVGLPAAFSLEGGLGHRWNDYRTDAFGLGAPREDRILDLRVGLRRTFGRSGSVAVGYQRQRRRSNLGPFDTDLDGLMIQLEFNVFAAAGYR